MPKLDERISSLETKLKHSKSGSNTSTPGRAPSPPPRSQGRHPPENLDRSHRACPRRPSRARSRHPAGLARRSPVRPDDRALFDLHRSRRRERYRRSGRAAWRSQADRPALIAPSPGRPLGITGEIAESEVIRLLNLELRPRQERRLRRDSPPIGWDRAAPAGSQGPRHALEKIGGPFRCPRCESGMGCGAAGPHGSELRYVRDLRAGSCPRHRCDHPPRLQGSKRARRAQHSLVLPNVRSENLAAAGGVGTFIRSNRRGIVGPSQSRPGCPMRRFRTSYRADPFQNSETPFHGLLHRAGQSIYIPSRKSVTSPIPDRLFFCQTGFRRPEWGAQHMSRERVHEGVCRVGWGSRERSSRQGALAP